MSAYFIKVALAQGTAEWRAWRHQGIGASEAPTIMDENPFKSPSLLLQEKRGPLVELTPNAAMARGTQLEPEARGRYVARTGCKVTPACLQSTKYHWMRASLDGLSSDGDRVVEIKCGKSVYWKARRYRSVPMFYYGQLQHIMAITNLKSIDFFCYWPGYPEILFSVVRDHAYIDCLLEKESDFWQAVQRSQSRPPVPPSLLPQFSCPLVM